MQGHFARARLFIRFVLILAIGCSAQAGAAESPATRPARPAWAAKEPAKWPQILLTNRLRLAGNRQLYGASGFLLRLPSGNVVAATAGHVLGEEVNLEDVGRGTITWTMHPPAAPQRKVTLRKVAMDRGAIADVDCLLMTVGWVQPWPVEVLSARDTPVERGERIFLIATTADQESPQKVYPATVVHRQGELFGYQLQEEVDTKGFSGAPLIDADGYAVGIHLGWFEKDGQRQMLRALDASIAAGLAIIGGAAGAEGGAAGAPPKPATDKPSAAKADAALEMCRSCIALKRYDVARRRLKDVIDTYPGTPAAKEAGRLLEEIADK